MIPVELAPEPEDFDGKVRQPGRRAIQELIGESDMPKRRGRPRQVVAASPDDIPPEKFPSYWTRALPDLREAYHNICSYMSFYIEPVTGDATVDHMLPKSVSWQEVYEWRNYRLACSLMNARKNDYRDVLDPFEIGDDWFRIELIGYQVIPKADLEPVIKTAVQATIDRLGLNDRECLQLREEYAAAYFERDLTLRRLRKRAPFLARELERQGRAVDEPPAR